MLPLFIAYYNFVRKRRALKMADGSYLTPAEMVGVDKDFGNDKWLGLIKKVTEYKRNCDNESLD